MRSTPGLSQEVGSALKLGIGLTGNAYIGDLTEAQTQRRFYPGSNLSIQFHNQKALRWQVNGGFGRFLEQVDQTTRPANLPEQVVPNRFVETSFFYGDFRLQYFLFPKARVQGYLSPGFGFMFFNPKDQEGNFLVENFFSRLENESYNTLIYQIPFSVGVQARVNAFVSLGISYTYRWTPSDYLDNLGQLGIREGNDALQQVQASVYINLRDARWETYDPAQGELPEEGPIVLEQTAEEVWHWAAYWEAFPEKTEGAYNRVSWVEGRDPDQGSSFSPTQFIYRPQGTNLSNLARELDISLFRLQDINQLVGEALPQAAYLRIPNKPGLPSSEIGFHPGKYWRKARPYRQWLKDIPVEKWLEMEKAALATGAYAMIWTSANRPEKLARQLGIRKTTLIRLNPFLREEVQGMIHLCLPDLEAVAIPE